MLPKDKKKDVGKSAKKDKDPVNESGVEAKSKRSQGKGPDGLNNLVLFDNVTNDTLCMEVCNCIPWPQLCSLGGCRVPGPP